MPRTHPLSWFVAIWMLAPWVHGFEDARVPGGLAVIEVPANSQPTFQDRPVLTVRRDGTTHAIVGLPLSLAPGNYAVLTEQSQHPFTVTGKRYLEQRIYLDNTRQVNPTPLDMTRIQAEAAAQQDVLNDFSGNLDDITLMLPVKGPISSPFGKRRFFNDQPRRPHSGTDIAAPIGTPIVAAADGRVSLVGDFFFNGRLVVIDHGEGLKTMYNHMDQIVVTEGQHVQQNTVIGTVGATGRVTGAHLHFGVILNGASVDPARVVPVIDTLPGANN